MGKPRIKTPQGRRYIREVLNLTQGYGYSAAQLGKKVDELAEPAESNHSEVREWIEWNHSKEYIRCKYDDDADTYLWFITREGIAKESIK